MGADDLFAILLASREARVAGLSLSFGCAPLPRVARNAAGAARVFGWEFPVTLGAARPVLGPVETAERILGPTGMRSRGAVLPEVEGDFPPALEPLADWTAAGGEVLALGPLTNLAVLALARPEALPDRITWMGGSLGRGNHTPHAEYNALADPEALAILLERGVTVRMVDLEACRKVLIDESDLAPLRPGLLADLLGGYLDIALERGRPAMALYDPVAAAAAVRPDLFETAPACLSVDLAGETRGRTQSGAGAANAEVISGLDAPAVKALCLAALEETA